MKKKNIVFATLLLGVVLTASVVGKTYSRYVTTDSGTGTATVAKWHAAITGFTGATGSKTITLTPVANTYVASGVIAPDSDAAGILTVDLTGTQVAVDLMASLGEITINGVSWTTAVPKGTLSDHFTTVLKIYEGTADDADIQKDLTGETGGATPLKTIEGSNEKYFIGLTNNAISKTSVKVAVGIHWTHNDSSTNPWDTLVGEYSSTAPTITATINLTAQQHVKSDS